LLPVFLASAALAPAPARASSHIGHVSEGSHLVAIGEAALLPKGSTRTGALPGRTSMSIEVVLPPRNQARLSGTLAAVTTPGTASYRHYLSRGAFAASYGATTATLNRVRAGLSRLGLTDSSVNANRLAILVRAPSSVIADALHIQLDRYRNASGEEFVEPSAAPLLPASIAEHVTAILGLSTNAELEPAGLSKRRSPAQSQPSVTVASPYTAVENPTCETSINTAEAGLTPDQIAAAYDMTGLYAEGDLGAGVSVGVIEFGPFVTSDIDAYGACLGVTPSVGVVAVDGGPQVSNPGVPGVDELVANNTVESELDLEDLIGLAPDASIIDYEGASRNGQVSGQAAYDTYAEAINADATEIISTSWGSCEPAMNPEMVTAENTIFEQAALQGQTIVAAAGDEGSEGCSDGSPSSTGQNDELAVYDPASQPFVTGVGGTTLTLAPTRTEVVWNTGQNSNYPGAGGGGVSVDWSMPAYQSDATPALGVAAAGSAPKTCQRSTGCRLVPDVAMDAGTPYAVFCTVEGCTGWTPIVGTSGAAPSFAALVALADASAACRAALPATEHSLGFLNPALYAIAGGPNAASAFLEITSGNNDVLGTNNGDYGAAPGYNLASGLGAPLAGNGADGALVADLCSPSSLIDVVETGGLSPPKVTSLSPNSGTSRGGERITITGIDLEHATAVLFGATPAESFRQLSATRILAVAPSGTGKTHVTVTTRAGVTALVRKGVFSFKVLPAIDRLAPPAGPASGHNVLVIIGTSLSGTTAVHFGKTVTHTFQVRSPTRLKVTVPPGKGVVTVTVTTRAGNSRTTTTTRYHYR
jgi:subtilase family serine protease